MHFGSSGGGSAKCRIPATPLDKINDSGKRYWEKYDYNATTGADAREEVDQNLCGWRLVTECGL